MTTLLLVLLVGGPLFRMMVDTVAWRNLGKRVDKLHRHTEHVNRLLRVWADGWGGDAAETRKRLLAEFDRMDGGGQ